MHFLKYKDIFASAPMPIQTSHISGEYKLVARRADNGKITYESPWRKNLITDYGLLYMAKNYWQSYIAIGTGNTPPVTTNTELNNFLALDNIGTSSGAPSSTISSNLTYPNLHTTVTHATRFNESVVGVIRELGICRNSNLDFAGGNNQMITHALVSPEYNKTASEIIDVYYRVTRYWDSLYELNTTGQIVLDGLTYDYLIKGLQCYNTNWSPTNSQDPYFRIYGSTGISVEPGSTNLDHNYDGSITTPTYSNSSYTDSAVQVGDSAYIDTHYTVGLNNMNHSQPLPKGIRTIHGLLNGSFAPGFQCQFTDTLNGWPIQKDRTKRLYLSYRATWTRL